MNSRLAGSCKGLLKALKWGKSRGRDASTLEQLKVKNGKLNSSWLRLTCCHFRNVLRLAVGLARWGGGGWGGEPAARVFYLSLVFSNDHRVLSQCNTRLRLFYLLINSVMTLSFHAENEEPHGRNKFRWVKNWNQRNTKVWILLKTRRMPES